MEKKDAFLANHAGSAASMTGALEPRERPKQD
jgi:hypothetical protein